MEVVDRETTGVEEVEEFEYGVTVEKRQVNITRRISPDDYRHHSPETQTIRREGVPETVVIDAGGTEMRPSPRFRDHLLELLSRCDGRVRITDSPSTIPTKIAAMGSPEVVVYLAVVHDGYYYAIGELLNINQSTVRQYMSDFVADRR